jgi:ribosomal protein S8
MKVIRIKLLKNWKKKMKNLEKISKQGIKQYLAFKGILKVYLDYWKLKSRKTCL